MISSLFNKLLTYSKKLSQPKTNDEKATMDENKTSSELITESAAYHYTTIKYVLFTGFNNIIHVCRGVCGGMCVCVVVCVSGGACVSPLCVPGCKLR